MSAEQSQQNGIIEAIDGFLSLLSDTSKDSDANLRKLAIALDSLVSAYNYTADVEPDTDDLKAPRIDYDKLVTQASKAFPELGYYGEVDPKAGLDQKIGLGDAIDDIADIARDLNEVLWLWENISKNEAVWMFRFGYETHWGKHLHDLRRYLHLLINYVA